MPAFLRYCRAESVPGGLRLTLRRRQFLRRTTSLAAIGLLTGCQALQGDGSADGTPTSTSTPPLTSSPTSTPGDETDVEALKQRSREFLELLAAGEFETAHGRFAESVQGRITSDQLSQVWTQLESTNGSFAAVAEAEYTTQSGYDVVVLTARFTNGRQRFVFSYQDGALVGFRIPPPQSGEWTPPDYADQSAFTEHERSVQATDSCSLGATLTMPNGDGPVPGVVLVHGNGAHDRDETVGPNKPFKDLAWGLASRGVAVLRYDKRTAACDVDLADVTVDEVVTNDALAAIDVLRSENRVDAGDVTVVGHSFGATLAPRIAAKDGNLAGAAMLAPLARPIPETIVAQQTYLAEVDGEVTDAERRQLDQIRALAEQIRTLDVEDDEVVLFGGREFWRTYTEYDKFQTARELEIPLALYFGGRDWQVTVEGDRSRWREEIGDEKDVTFQTYDSLNHFFVSGSGKSTPQEYFEPANVAQQVVVDLATWVDDVAGSGP